MYKVFLLISALMFGACCGNARKNSAGTSGMTEKTARVSDTHTAETSSGYAGTYFGILPAADCPGIETELKLSDDGTFTLSESYIDRDAMLYDNGTYRAEGNLLTLYGTDEVFYFKAEGNRLCRLDADRKEITGPLAGHYILRKTN